MGPAELIGLTNFSNEQKYELLDIIRRENVVEELINYILLRETKLVCYEEAEYDNLKDEIENLKHTNNLQEQTIQRLRVTCENKKLAAESFTKFVETFQKENNRYPSIDEAWNASWNSYKESMRGV